MDEATPSLPGDLRLAYARIREALEPIERAHRKATRPHPETDDGRDGSDPVDNHNHNAFMHNRWVRERDDGRIALVAAVGELLPTIRAALSLPADGWVTLTAERALYVDQGKTTILCDRLPSPITLVLKNPVHAVGGFLPTAETDGLPLSLADREGTSASPPISGDHASDDTVFFVQQWMLSSDYKPDQWTRDFAAAIDARSSPADGWQTIDSAPCGRPCTIMVPHSHDANEPWRITLGTRP